MIRLLREDELRAAGDLHRAAEHLPDATDAVWAARGWYLPLGRTYGAFRDGSLAGTAATVAGRLRIPGGDVAPVAIGTAAGVRSDRTRRGVLTGLLRAVLTGLAEPVMVCWPTEAGIYGRFGYGVATRVRELMIDRRRAVPRTGVPSGGVHTVSLDDAATLLPALHDRAAGGAGRLTRSPGWWQVARVWQGAAPGRTTVAVHDEGFAIYTVARDADRTVLTVRDLFARGPTAFGALWRFLLSLDLVDEIRAPRRPVDEPVEELVVDRRVVTTSAIEDDAWLRLVDVPAALALRPVPEDAGSVVIEVRDEFLPANSGAYAVGGGPARRVAEPADLSMDVDVLAQLYLGDGTPSALARAGRIDVARPGALATADRLFALPTAPWCGTYY